MGDDLMNYINNLNSLKIPMDSHNTLTLDLFAGCGGLALGFELEGFHTIGYEMNNDCVDTYNKNLKGECHNTMLNEFTEFPNAPVIIGGPPCQPFSVGGKQAGHRDDRNGFPAFISAVKRVNPEIFIFENVRGMLYKNKPYFDEIIAELKGLGYEVEYHLLNAKNFGVPQNRERVICVGHKGGFEFPKPKEYLVTVEDAISDLNKTAPTGSRFLTESMDKYILKYEIASKCKTPRDLHPDKPARTLTCRNLAGATGDMHRVKLPDGRRRRLLVREAARIQSFPDWFAFEGNETSQFNQIGNAVPPLFAKEIASRVNSYLGKRNQLNGTQLSLNLG
jgi:DNA (cytosine-5)-methyltransferase 1